MEGRYFRFEGKECSLHTYLWLFGHWYGRLEVGFESIDSCHLKLLPLGERRVRLLIDGREASALGPVSPEIRSLIEKTEGESFLLYINSETAARLWLEGLLQEEVFENAKEEEERIILPLSLNGKDGLVLILKEGKGALPFFIESQ